MVPKRVNKRFRILIALSILWSLPFVYYFGLSMFFRIIYSSSFYWGNPPQTVPAWFYIPEHVIIFLPVLAVGVSPLFMLITLRKQPRLCQPASDTRIRQ